MGLRKFGNYDLDGKPPVLAWNPVTMRCTRVDEGCRNCWHLRMCERLAANASLGGMARRSYGGGYPKMATSLVKGGPCLPKRPSVIAVQFMGDLWHMDVLPEYRKIIFGICRDNPRHIFLFLTKRPERVTETLPENCWLGVSAHNAESAKHRTQWLELKGVAPERRWLSLEPLLAWDSQSEVGIVCRQNGIGWVACGEETGAGRRLPEGVTINWVADSCSTFGIPFYDKREPVCADFTRREWNGEWKEKIGGRN